MSDEKCFRVKVKEARLPYNFDSDQFTKLAKWIEVICHDVEREMKFKNNKNGYILIDFTIKEARNKK